MHTTTDTVLKNLSGSGVVVKRNGLQQAKTTSITGLSQTIPEAFQSTITVREWTGYQTQPTKTIKGTSLEEERNGALSLLHSTLKLEAFQLEKRIKQPSAPGLLFSDFQSICQPLITKRQEPWMLSSQILKSNKAIYNYKINIEKLFPQSPPVYPDSQYEQQSSWSNVGIPKFPNRTADFCFYSYHFLNLHRSSWYKRSWWACVQQETWEI